ncbi:reticulon-like protein B2 [Ananas comosus]|uniref:Reticulon-like protein n=2 Tax=Ananas comosus TaxID=4615 RepID=A0A6P5GL31_ANACO|nr:reticulon-like protein B2 [Ananas comosus]CAD1823499.1 unnamed protein product [Ananas comosus var. bracteatus]
MPPQLRYGSDSDEQPAHSATAKKPFGRERPLHQLIGGGKLADVLLWRNKNLSAGILAAATVAWFLFEVAEYHVLTLLCHLSVAAMLVVFIWSNGAHLFERAPPKIPEVIVSEHAFKEVAFAFHAKLNRFLSILYEIACGKDLKLFLLAIVSLWFLSILGSSCSFITLLYLGFLCIHTLPALYERYEAEVDHLLLKGSHDLKKFYKRFDSSVLNKIPRQPIKEKKHT